MSEKPDLGLEADDLSPDPMTQFRRWFDDAEAEGIHLANAVALATAGADGRPNVRHVLLRRFDEDGFVFYTNYESRKARELSENPWAAFTLLWRELDRQVGVQRFGGAHERRGIRRVLRPTRPREAQIGTWASPQSDVIEGRDTLMTRFDGRGRAVPRRRAPPAELGRLPDRPRDDGVLAGACVPPARPDPVRAHGERGGGRSASRPERAVPRGSTPRPGDLRPCGSPFGTSRIPV